MNIKAGQDCYKRTTNKTPNKTGWFVGLLLIIAAIIMIGLLVSTDFSKCLESVKGFCD